MTTYKANREKIQSSIHNQHNVGWWNWKKNTQLKKGQENKSIWLIRKTRGMGHKTVIILWKVNKKTIIKFNLQSNQC